MGENCPVLSWLHRADFIPDVDDDADSAKMLRHLELIDGEASEYGVRIVKLDDALMAKKYGHRDPVRYVYKLNYLSFIVINE